MTITIYNCDREPSYLEDTLRTIPDGCSVEIIWQKEDVHQPATDSRIKLVTPQPFKTIQHDTKLNYAMTLLYSTDGIIFEDDVIVSKNFPEHLKKVKSLIQTERYIIALYAYRNWKPKGRFELVNYPFRSFFGLQAMMYDEFTKKDLARWLLDGLVLEDEPHDFAVRTYSKEYDVPLLALNYSLVQHIGYTSSGLGGLDFHHQSPNFVDDLFE